ncbi:MAG TPA: hypothetical protein VFZ98_09790, partial [Vicinamibacterales bacterium]
MKRRGFCGLLLVLATATSQRAVVRASNGVSDSFGALAPAFVANPDSESEASLISVGGGRPIFFTRHDVRIVDPPAARSLWLSFVGTDEPVISGDHPTGGRVAFVRRPATIVRPAYHEVVYRGLWTGIDARITGEGGGLEYAFEIAAGANPGAIRLRYLGVDRMRLEANGDLALAADGQTIVDRAPIAYQLVRGRRQSVPVRFALRESKVTFEVGDYDRARPLVID